MIRAMSKVMLRTRNLSTGDNGVFEHPDVATAISWLKERPSMTEVVGVVFEGITKDENDRMKAAMRALDEDEKKAVKILDEAAARERMEKIEAKRRDAEADAVRMKEAARTADPKRSMELRYRYDTTELSNTDAYDERPITDEARAAVLAFVAERNEWVEGRGQIVGEAKVRVFPGEIPKGKERVDHGSFVPVSAPEKKAD